MIKLEQEKYWRLSKDFKKGKFCFLIEVDNWSIDKKVSLIRSIFIIKN